MKELIVTSQEELDAVAVGYDGRIIIKFGTPYNRAVVNRHFKYSVEARENSSVVARGNSSVEARGNSSVVARENSSVVARENSSVVAWGNSSVEAWENSSVEAWENSSVVARGNSQVCDISRTHNIKVSGNARIVYNPRNIFEYCEANDIVNDGTVCRLFKAVHKLNGKYVSNYDYAFVYTIGESVKSANGFDSDPEETCGRGIHMAHKSWCVSYGICWKDLAILELEAEMSEIVVPLYEAGKVRAPKAKVIREVPLEECGLIGKIAEKRLKNA